MWVGMMEHAIVSYMTGYLDCLLDLGRLTKAERELWGYRITTCPGHHHDPTRNWCAYCGTLETPSDDSNDL